jgi:hypothetical protein
MTVPNPGGICDIVETLLFVTVFPRLPEKLVAVNNKT